MSNNIERIELDKLLESSVKEKAQAVLYGYEQLIAERATETIYSKEEVDKIVRSLYDEKEAKEFSRYFAIFKVLLGIYKLLGVSYKNYKEHINAFMNVITELNGLIAEENRINILLQAMRDISPEAEKAFIETAKNSLYYKKAKIVVSQIEGVNYIKIHTGIEDDKISVMKEEVEMYYSECEYALRILKGEVEAIEEFVKSHRGAKSFIPSLVETAINGAKEDKALSIDRRYSHRRLKELETQGNRILDEDKKGVFFPDYYEIERVEKYYILTKQKLEDLSKTYEL